MNNETKNMILPKLRFPEFSETDVWEEKTIDEICEVLNNCRKPVTENNRVKGEYPYYGASGIVDYVDSFLFDEKLLLVGEDGAKWGAFEKTAFIVDGKYWVNNHAHVLRTTGINETFLENYLVMLDFTKFITGAAPPKLTLGKLKEILVPVPSNNIEQQKIADCLYSVDDLIRAESQKLYSYRIHKKGLMQRLFPVDGETVPKLRFQQFENNEAWVERTLDELGRLINGLTYSPNDVRETGLLVLRSSNIQNGKIVLHDNVYVREDIKGANLSEPNDILICVRNGSKALIGKNAVIKEGMPLCTHGAFMTVFRSPASAFVFQLFQTESYIKQVSGDLGATINSINGSNFIKYTFFVPNNAKEQKIIADCLSSLDDLILAQSEKVEALKQHKKGLMQILFPNK